MAHRMDYDAVPLVRARRLGRIKNPTKISGGTQINSAAYSTISPVLMLVPHVMIHRVSFDVIPVISKA
jgi:hypothetical protein